MPQIQRPSRIKRLYAVIVVLCFYALWIVPVGCGQAHEVSRQIADCRLPPVEV